ncbi:MAG: beta-ketoacyl synthase N-terminal-like domain-containing protein, partial [Desulfobacteraceae bacterium]
MKAAAITGMGIISSLGNTIDQVAESLEKGRSGIILDRSREEKGFKSGLTSALEEFSPNRWGFTKKSLRTMGEPALFASAAAMDAVEDSGLPNDVMASDRCGPCLWPQPPPRWCC